MRITSRISGVRDVLRIIRRQPTSVDIAVRESLDTWADEMKSTAKRLAPVRTGRLRNSIESRVNYGTKVAYVGVWKRPAIEYAYYVEKGTSKMSDQPYLGPAFQMHRRASLRDLERNVRRRLRG